MLPYLSTEQGPLNSSLGKKLRFYERKISNKQFPLKKDSGETESTTMSCMKVLGHRSPCRERSLGMYCNRLQMQLFNSYHCSVHLRKLHSF